MKLNTRHIWRDSAVPVVVDASALDWLVVAPVPKHVIRVITAPHPGEGARGCSAPSAQQVQADWPGLSRCAKFRAAMAIAGWY